MRKILVCAFVVGCGEPTPPGDAMRFRDNFDSLASAWEVSDAGVSVEDGKLFMRAGVGAAPEAKYTLPSAFGPGWDFSVNSAVDLGRPCSAVEISTGHDRRHTWALELEPDSARGHWGLQVGNGDGWEILGTGSDVPDPATARLMVDGGDVGLWLNDEQVVDTMIEGAAPNAVSINLAVSRCRIVGGVGKFDWVEIKELDR